VLTGNSFLRPIFQLPLSGSLDFFHEANKIAHEMLSTPSLGITSSKTSRSSRPRSSSFQLPLSGSRFMRSSTTAIPKRTFQLPLSGSPYSFSSVAPMTQAVTFNSLSRDHVALRCCEDVAEFELPFNSLSRDHVRAVGELFGTASDATFNSLSRDHLNFILDFCADIAFLSISFNSLSRDHCGMV